MNNIRRSIRFPAEPKDIAWVEVQPAEGHSEFQAQVAALIINESFTGCALILSTVSLNGHTLEENTFIKVKVGPLGTEIQLKSLSIRHFELQPSPFIRFPSSHDIF